MYVKLNNIEIFRSTVLSPPSGALYHPPLLVDDEDNDDDNVFILDVQVDVGPAGFSAIAP